jgi:hypothetical protein
MTTSDHGANADIVDASEPAPGPEHDTDTESDVDDPVMESARVAASTRIRRHVENARVTGQLTVHFQSRSVVFEVDGATALSLIGSWQRPPLGPPPCDPGVHTAAFPRIGIDVAEVVAVTWQPRPAASTSPSRTMVGTYD